MSRLSALAKLYKVSVEDLCGDDLPLTEADVPIVQGSEKLPQEIEDQLFLLRQVWPRLFVEERQVLLTAVLGLVRTRPESA